MNDGILSEYLGYLKRMCGFRDAEKNNYPNGQDSLIAGISTNHFSNPG